MRSAEWRNGDAFDLCCHAQPVMLGFRPVHNPLSALLAPDVWCIALVRLTEEKKQLTDMSGNLYCVRFGAFIDSVAPIGRMTKRPGQCWCGHHSGDPL